MTPQAVLETIIAPAQALLRIPRTPQSDVLMLAIGLQESRLEYRRQIAGPARGFWQFERGGGVKGVLTHPASMFKAAKLCVAREVEANSAAVYDRLEHDDQLAAGFARLLLLTDPRPLPDATDADGAWAYYLRNWRPGKPHPQTWAALHAQAVAAAT